MTQRLAWSIMAVGLLGMGVGGAGVATHVGQVRAVLDDTVHEVPGDFTVNMTSGRWEVFEIVGTRHTKSIGAFSSTIGTNYPPVAFAAKAVGPGNRAVDVESQTSSVIETLTRGHSVYRAEATMDIHVAGRYSFTIVTRDGAQTDLVVAPDLGSAAVAVLPWAVLTVVGLLVAVLGFILLMVRRRRRQTPGPPFSGLSFSGPPPPGPPFPKPPFPGPPWGPPAGAHS